MTIITMMMIGGRREEEKAEEAEEVFSLNPPHPPSSRLRAHSLLTQMTMARGGDGGTDTTED